MAPPNKVQTSPVGSGGSGRPNFQVGDMVVIEGPHPSVFDPEWVGSMMDQFVGPCLFRVEDAAQNPVTLGWWLALSDPYRHFAGLSVSQFVWKPDWLRVVAPALQPQAKAAKTVKVAVPAPPPAPFDPKQYMTDPDSCGGDLGYDEPLSAEPVKVPKKETFVYTQKHEITPQQPGETDKAYLRRILGR